jgi:hypothetical protein
MTRRGPPGSLDRRVAPFSYSSEPGPATAADRPGQACTGFVLARESSVRQSRDRLSPCNKPKETAQGNKLKEALFPRNQSCGTGVGRDCGYKEGRTVNGQSESEPGPADPETRAEAGPAAARWRAAEARSAATAPRPTATGSRASVGIAFRRVQESPAESGTFLLGAVSFGRPPHREAVVVKRHDASAKPSHRRR